MEDYWSDCCACCFSFFMAVCTDYGWRAAVYTSKPTDVLQAAVEDWELLWPAIQITVAESVIGFVISAIIGIGFAVLLASSKILEISIYPYAVILQTIPVVAVAPIVVIWFGSGFNSIVMISFLIGFFPIISNTLMGLNSVDKNMSELFTLYNASKWQKCGSSEFRLLCLT